MATIDQIIIIDHTLFTDKLFIQSLKENFNISIDLQTSTEVYNQHAQNVLYISQSFSGPLFDLLVKHKKPIISDLVVEQCIHNRIALPNPKHPLFNYFMKDFIICFSIDDKRNTSIINKYLNLIRFMGGQSRRDMKSGKSFERTHLIESRTDSENYKLASIYGIPILRKEWIDFLWENRRCPDFLPNDEEHLTQFRIQPFYDLRICLFNFSPDETEHFTEKITSKGGTLVSINDCNCSHFVVDTTQKDSVYFDILEGYAKLPNFVVSEKWLIRTLQLNYRDQEELYQLRTPLFDTTNHLETTPNKTNDSISHHTFNSIVLSPNFDQSFTEEAREPVDKSDQKKQAICQELYETETNYVAILKDILKVFRDPLRNHQMPEEFPNEIELKTIFGGLPPIIDVHEKILSELGVIVENWKAENDIGKIFQKHSRDFLSVYPQYVNYYEKTKETIEQCINKYPKFHKFLQACHTLPECRKQKFQDLLINPIQRLPRIEILLKALLSRTDKLHPDYKLLNEAINTITSVISEINMNKKKTEGQIEMFDILNDIEDCPATLLSAKRHLITKCDSKLLIQTVHEGKVIAIDKLDRYLFTLLLFSDILVICKKRTVKRSNSLRERTTNLVGTTSKKSKRTYKFIESINLDSLKNVIYEFADTDLISDCENSFALVCHSSSHQYFPIYPFAVKDSDVKKDKFLEELHKAYEFLPTVTLEPGFFIRRSAFQLNFNHSKNLIRPLSNQPKYLLQRTKEKLNRTFSIRRPSNHLPSSVSMENLSTSFLGSPSSKRLSRVFTSFFSPTTIAIKENGNLHHPLGSINDIHEMSHSDDGNSDDGADNFSLPSTPAPRKKKFQQDSNS